MPAITLPDKSVRRFDGPVTGTTVAESIGPGLARAALAMKLDGKLVDLGTEIDRDADVTFVTRRDAEALELIRHDAAHVLAEAVQELYPGTQVTIGPAIENGFYYDFARDEPFTPEDFPPIEAKMREIVGRGEKFVRQVIDRDEAIRFFQDKGEKYKAEIIEDLPRGETITLYGTGFGPYDSPVPDGFYPPVPLPKLVDPVDVLMGDNLVIQPIWAGAGAGFTGVTELQLPIGSDVPTGAPLKLTVRVNGKLSNTALLPLQ